MTGADLIALAKKHPVSTVCLLLIVASGVTLYFRWDAAAQSQTVYDATAAEANKMIANVKNAPGLEEQVAEIQQLGKEIDSRLIKASQLAVNLQYFYKLEADTGVKLLDVRQNNPRPRPGKPTFIPIPFSLSVQGNHGQVMKFLNELQIGRHFCRITGTSFSKVGGVSSEGNTSPATQDLSLALTVELLSQP